MKKKKNKLKKKNFKKVKTINKKKGKKRKKKKKINLSKLVMAFGVAVFIYIVIFFSFFSIGKVQGYSMIPTINNNDKVIINRYKTIKRFDIIYLKTPKQSDEKSVRRVIGMPGDSIVYKSDELYVNDELVSESFLTTKKKQMGDMILTDDFILEEILGQKKVPKDYYFVLGDNRKSSTDSRYYGFVPIDKVVGKVETRVFPLKNFKKF